MLLLEESLLRGSVEDYFPISIANVNKTDQESLWDDLVRKYHYLGFGTMIGQRIKYLVTLKDRPIAALSYNRAALRVGVRETFIGWTDEARQKLLKRIVCNHRFLILPRVEIKNLASHVLSLSLRILPHDWKRLYGYEPYLVETFVDSDKFNGTCYYAANFKYLGETKGYGKLGNAFEYHGNKKKVFLYELNKNFIKTLPIEYKKAHVEQRDYWEEAKKQLVKPGFYIDSLKSSQQTDEMMAQIIPFANGYLDDFQSCFNHISQYRYFIRYFMGLLSTLPNKSAKSIGEWLGKGYETRFLTSFMHSSPWSHEKMLDVYQDKLSKELTAQEGMITVDNYYTGRIGNNIVGLSPQPFGITGRVKNGQSSLIIGYSSFRGYGFVDRALYMPEIWFSEEYAEKRGKCGVPTHLEFKDRIKLANEIIRPLLARGVFQAKWIGIDSVFFRDTNFIRAIPAGMYYFADIQEDDIFSALGTQTHNLTNNLTIKTNIITIDKVKQIIAQSNIPWKPVEHMLSPNNPVYWEEKIIPVRDTRVELSNVLNWLYAVKTKEGVFKYFVSNAPENIPPYKFEELFIRRYLIERSFSECKYKLGFEEFGGKSWNGFYRHSLMVFVANLFVNLIRKYI